jgi:phosphoglycerol transferase MdoB-like AlkP superfamily enzyme
MSQSALSESRQEKNALHAARSASWRTSQYGFVAFWLISLLANWAALRLVLLFQFNPSAPAGAAVLAFLFGSWRDLLVAIWFTLPLFCWLALMPERASVGWPRRCFSIACISFWFGQIFLCFVEYFFFDEFKSRFNTVAVDYLEYPTEVFVNIWDSYHVGVVLATCLLLALVWMWTVKKIFAGVWDRPFSNKSRLLMFPGLAALAGVFGPIVFLAGGVAGFITSPLHLNEPRISNNRTLNEIANNGELAFFSAALTHHLDYSAFYRTLDRNEAYWRARRLLAQPGTRFVDRPDSLQRWIAGDSARPRLNVVILLEESFGSEFWGCLGRTNTLTPEMDQLATREGVLFTNLYASGNRTVRGMEGVLASFPPLPGESIVKRDFSDHVETIARLLKRDGYSTLFLYGGRGAFDGMRSFTLRNGYDRFIEQKHFQHPTFTTVWGVCDEDLYDRSIEEFDELSKSGKPFFATILSVSNHKPYTYPRDRIPEDPEARRRENAVKYADFALGRFFRAAKKETFWTNTIFAVVADHGARVYGEQNIPIRSYEIPLLIVGPAAVSGPSRVGRLGCSLDVAPTLLGLIGRPYETTFFGQDLLNSSGDIGRALLNHNRDIGLLANQRLVVLSLLKGEEFYSSDPKLAEMKPLPSPDATDRELERDAIALYEAADDLYTHQRYRIEESPIASAPQNLR